MGKNRRAWRGPLMCAASWLAANACPVSAADRLEDGFVTPPHAARPQVWWHWMSGNVSSEGAQLDLAWMHRVGVGGVHAFAGGGLEPTVIDKPLLFMSSGWRDAYRDAVKAARSYGMDVTIAGSPGWSQTGGPWVAPKDGMKKYVWSEVQVDGGAQTSIDLPHPPTTTGAFMALPKSGPYPGMPAPPSPQAYGDAAVFAFPTPLEETRLKATYTSSAGALPALAAAAQDLSASISLPLASGSQPFVDVDLGRIATVAAVTIAADPAPGFTVLVRNASGAFVPVASFQADTSEHPAPQQTFAFPPVSASVLRVRFDRPAPPKVLPGLPDAYKAMMSHPPTAILLHRLEFVSGARIDRFEAKAGFQPTADFSVPALQPEPTPGAVVSPESVVDLTGRERPDGSVDWTPPPGRWTIVRLGWSLTGQNNGPAEASSATGLEVDKLDGAAVTRYIDALLSLYTKDAGTPLGDKGVGSLLTDSWEAGVQNWTPEVQSQFKRLRGYDPSPWLPVLTGRVVKDPRSSDAFLFDFRQTLKDLVVQNHYAVLARETHKRGMTYYTEVQGDTPRAISDGLTAKAQSDIPTGEFWYRPFATDPGQPSLVVDLEEAASAAHLYGKPLVAAEAMTVAAGADPWAFSPAMLKPVADEIFAHGVNRILVHDSHMQPDVSRKPGLELGFFGQFFNRNDTWAEEARPWSDYLARTSYMLQQGRSVSDIAYVYGEEQNLTKLFEHGFNTDVPKGYGFDYVDPTSLLDALEVVDGEVVSRGGAHYQILYVPAHVTRMTLGFVRKLDALVRAGAVLVARKPTGGLGLQSSDSLVQAVSDNLWGPDGGSPGGRRVGKGQVYATADLAKILVARGLAPDVDLGGADILSVHRRTSDADIYFVSNRAAHDVKAQLTFRVSGASPEFWSADDASRRPLSYRRSAGRTQVTLPLDANGAGFVVFRTPAAAAFHDIPEPAIVSADVLKGPWNVAFEPGRGAPATARFDALTDWSRNTDPSIRYFSGAATYSRSLTITREMLRGGPRMLLDLGAVKELAVVSIDGRAVATAWKPPYRVDLTDTLTPGPHRLDIKVINLWPNRLIGDKQPGAVAIAWAPQSPYTAASPLLASGLLGPVRLVRESLPSASPERAQP